MLAVKALPVGPFQANCYLVFDSETREAIIVDPGAEAETIVGKLSREGLTAKAIWLTHAHLDHIGALAAVKSKLDLPIWIHTIEKDWPTDGSLNGSARWGVPVPPQAPTDLWNDGDEFEALGRQWKVFHTPGHSPGSVCLHCEAEKTLIAGDLLFRGSIGRVDLPGADPEAMGDSLRRIFTLPPVTNVYPGHGPATTLAIEKIHNQIAAEFMAGEGF